MARSHEVRPEESLGSLLVPDSLAAWAWMFGFAAMATTFLLVKRLPLMGVSMEALAKQPGVPIGTYILTHLFTWMGAGPVIVLQAVAGGSLYLLIRHVTRIHDASVETAHLLGIAAVLSPAALATTLGDVSPDMFILPAVVGLVFASDKRTWAPYLGSLFLILLFTNVAPMVLGLAGLALLVEGKYSWGAVALAIGLIVAPGLSLLLGNAQIQGGLLSWYLGGAPAGLVQEIHHLGQAFSWIAQMAGWKEVLFFIGPIVAFLALSGKRRWNPWWVPALGLILLHLGVGSSKVVGWEQLSLSAAGFLFVAVARSLSEVDLLRLGPARMALLAIPPVLMVAYVLSPHIGV